MHFSVRRVFAYLLFMTKPKIIKENSKTVRDVLLNACAADDDIHEIEKRLVEMLSEVDNKKLYIRFGYKSLTGFCIQGLRFSKTQAQWFVIFFLRLILLNSCSFVLSGQKMIAASKKPTRVNH